MCGICGLVGFRHGVLGPGAAGRVEAMLGALAHRGPDASALHVSDPEPASLSGPAGAAVLGATRLAIRGLADGRQPLIDAASGVVAVCNGEIDNHRELRAWLAARGRPVTQATDVAVIPGLYLELGEAFPAALVGAFAIGLWDPGRRRLLLVRDRAGEKPLFYRVDPASPASPGWALFATELAALAANGAPGAGNSGGAPGALGLPPAGATAAAGADVEALAHYLRFGSFAVPRTPFAGMQKVGPGECVVLAADGVRRERYWRWRTPETPAAAAARLAGTAPAVLSPSPGRSEGPAPVSSAGLRPAAGGRATPPTLDDLDRVFRQAVARQIEVEVPCGVFLSGGVDSSLVTAVARSVRPDVPLRAFSLRFPESSYDEGEVAARVARRLGLATTEVWVRPEDFTACLPELVRMAGEPLADPAWVPAALLARRAAAEVRQVLVGEGGDELFGGYPTHSGVWLGERYERLPRPLRRLLAGVVGRLPPSDKKVTLSFLLKRFVAGEGLEGLERHLLWTSNIAPETLARLGVPPAPPAAAWSVPPAGTVLDRVQQHDLETSLAEGLLTKADRASMHFALELRAPFLDRDVMELAAGLRDEQRVRGLATKVFLKRYARRYLPRWVVHRRKRGLSVPLASWLRGPLRGWAEERLTAGRLGAVGIDEAAAAALLGEHLRRERDHARALWTLVVLAEWLDWAAALGTRGEDAEAAGLPRQEAADRRAVLTTA
ncbi:MAG TPA: asparagine synthase-related protein [Thermoanaerobaculia bacterium]|nr:asparagine synthase-related protein [Thermoanaerobaculia bacterium]